METAQQLFNSIHDPEVLRRMGLHLLEEIEKLNKVVQKSRDEADKKESEKQLWIDQAIKLNPHKLQRVAFGFGRELSKLRDRERRKTEKQLTLQTSSLVNAICPTENDNLPLVEKIHLQDEATLLERCHLSGLVFSYGDQIEIE